MDFGARLRRQICVLLHPSRFSRGQARIFCGFPVLLRFGEDRGEILCSGGTDGFDLRASVGYSLCGFLRPLRFGGGEPGSLCLSPFLLRFRRGRGEGGFDFGAGDGDCICSLLRPLRFDRGQALSLRGFPVLLGFGQRRGVLLPFGVDGFHFGAGVSYGLRGLARPSRFSRGEPPCFFRVPLLPGAGDSLLGFAAPKFRCFGCGRLSAFFCACRIRKLLICSRGVALRVRGNRSAVLRRLSRRVRTSGFSVCVVLLLCRFRKQAHRTPRWSRHSRCE